MPSRPVSSLRFATSPLNPPDKIQTNFPKLPRPLRFDKYGFQTLFDEKLIENRDPDLAAVDTIGLCTWDQMLFHIGIVNAAGKRYGSSRTLVRHDDRRRRAHLAGNRRFA